MTKMQTTDNAKKTPNAILMWNRKPYLLLVQMKYVIATLENSLVVKAKHAITNQ